jgi:transcriptional regulator with XRE-family HTH domain
MAPVRHQLIDRREWCGLSQEGLARALGVTVRSVRRWEKGESMPPAETRRELARKLGGWSMAELLSALGDDPGPDERQVIPESLTLYAGLERGAARLWSWQPLTVHALLQTAGYATAVERTGVDPTETRVAQRVRLRLSRQAVLERTDEPPLRLHVVLDESVLRRVTGDGEVMAAQLDHLVRTAEARPHVTVQILPLAGPCHAAAFGAFTMLASLATTPGTDPEPQMVCVEDRMGIRYLEGLAVRPHCELFDVLTAAALSPAASLDVIRHTRKELYQ